MKVFKNLNFNLLRTYFNINKMQTEKTVGTHSGSFHMDEVLGCVMLTKYTQEFKDAKIVRSRDEQLLNTFDIVIDVGRVYDAERYRFDHHQKEFTGTFNENYTIKLSSAGLVYKHFGKEIVRNLAEQLLAKYEETLILDEENLALVYQRLYDNFILSVDAIDNGENQYPSDVQPKYKVKSDLGSRIGRLNPASYEKNVSFDERFFEAMKIADEELIYQVREIVLGWLTARVQVEAAFNARHQVHESGEIILFERPCAWKDPIFEIEKKYNAAGQVKFVLFKDTSGGEGWRVQAVPTSAGGFTNRKSLRKDWCGVSRDEAAKNSGLDDIVFCHANGFIGGARSYESALKMAILSIQA